MVRSKNQSIRKAQTEDRVKRNAEGFVLIALGFLPIAGLVKSHRFGQFVVL